MKDLQKIWIYRWQFYSN